MQLNKCASIKEMIQSFAPSDIEVITGIVVSADPLRIEAVNDSKLILNENTIIIPWHLTDYITKCDIMLDNGTIDSQTQNDGQHMHGPNGDHSQYQGSGVHSHTASDETSHVHALRTFNVFGATIKVHNALKEGDMLCILSFNQGKKYYALDRLEAL